MEPKHITNPVFPGGYRLVRMVGRGCFAEVYEAVAASGERVAIKVLTSHHPQAWKRFHREVKVLRALPANPYVVAYLDHGTLDDGSLFLVTEFVVGFTLGRLLASGRRFSEQAACALMLQLCKAFAGLHRLGVTHGDVKPNNVMLTKPPTSPGLSSSDNASKVIHLAQVERSSVEVRLLDFGLVRDAQGLLNLLERHSLLPGRDFEEELDAGMLTGTPEYIAPEQLADARRPLGTPARTDTSADVFALGVVFYEMLAGAVPWPFVADDADGADDKVVVKVKSYLDRRAAGQMPTPPRGIGRALWAIIARALDPDPKLRPRDAAALAEDLQRYMEFGIGVTEQLDTQATMVAQLEPDQETSSTRDLPERRRNTSRTRSEPGFRGAHVEDGNPMGRSSLLSLLQVPAKAKQTILRYSPQSRWSRVTVAAVALGALALVAV